MTSTDCLLKEIIKLLKILNDRIQVRTNAIIVLDIDTSNTQKRRYNIAQEFGAPRNVIATQLTVTDVGGGFYIDTNNSGFIPASIGYEIENETISNLEVYGSGEAGTAKIRLGAVVGGIV